MKRAIALFLALIFVFTLVPVSALAIEPTNPTVKFTIGFKEKKIVNGVITETALSGGGTFTREYDAATGDLLGASEETVNLPKVKKVVKEIELVNNATGWMQQLSTGDIKDGAVKLNLAGITVDPANPANITATIILSYMDPTVTWDDQEPDIISVTYPGKASGLTPGESVPVGSIVTVAFPTGTASEETETKHLSRLKLGTGNSVSLSHEQATATFTMPDEDVNLTVVYEYLVTLKNDLDTVLDTKWMVPEEKATLGATEPVDEMLDPSQTPQTDDPEAVYDSVTNSVEYTMPAGTDAAVTITLETFVQLYKLNLEDCELDPDTTISGAYKTGTNVAYIEDGADVTLRATTAANTYQWRKNGNDITATGVSDEIGRTITFSMLAEETTYSVTAVDQYKVTQMGPDGAVAEETYHIPGATVTATAPAKKDNTYDFAYWRIDGVSTEVAAGKLNRNPITFTMPSADITLTPVYLTSLQLTDARIKSATPPAPGAPAPVKYKTEIVDGRTVESYWVTPGTALVFESAKPAGDDGSTYTLGSWSTNGTMLSGTGAVANPTMTMPADDVEVRANWRSYTLTVRRFVNNSRVETYTLRPGERVTFDAEIPTGGTVFNYWSHSSGLKIVVNDVEVDANSPTTQRITVVMGSSNANVTANYNPQSDLSYLITGAHIELVQEPVRYYALLEYFNKDSLVVNYYPNQENTNGVRVDNSQLVCRVIDPKTGETATDSSGCFNKVGDFALEITFYVNGKKMADTRTVLNTPSTYIHVYTNRPEYVASYSPYNKLNKSVYYSGEDTGNINKDGLVVNLISADHVTEGVRYFTARELAANEYDLVAFNPLAEQYATAHGKAYDETDIPKLADIKDAIDHGLAGYKRVDTGKKDASGDIIYKYYMQLGIKFFDETQMDSDGKPKEMRYLPSEDDAIWIEVRDTENTKLDLEEFLVNKADAESTPTADPEVKKKNDTWPSYSWEIDYSKIATGRTFKLKVEDGDFDSIAIMNEDSSVAAISLIESDDAAGEYTYRLTPRTVGVTKLTFYVRGHELIDTDPTTGDPKPVTTMATLEVTVRDDLGAVIDVDDLDKLNKPSATVYVGNRLTLYPAVYSPNNADTTMRWFVAFKDDLLPKNAEYYCKVDPVTGVVEALKYTDRTILVTAQAVNFSGTTPSTITDGKLDGTNQGDVATCEITIAQIPVYSMTMYPTELTMYRKASTTLTTRLYPEAATDQKLNWTSSNSNIVSVDNEGRITANMLGTATITATASGSENNSVYKSCIITVKESVLLTEITLSRNSAMLGIGESTPLSVYYSPAKATTQTVTWETSDASVATVTATGKIHGIAEGTAVITATANDGSGKKAACVVSVSNIVSSAVVLNKQTLAIIEDESETLTATIYPTNASNARVLWSSSNTKVAVVDQDGEVTGTGGGSAVITATARDASAKYADCVVVVAAKIPVTSIALNLGDFDMLLNDTTILTPTVTPANATYKVTWTSSDKSVATIDEKGKLSALKTGSSIITCKAGDMTKAITVNVVTKTFSTGKVVNCTRRVNVRANASGTGTILGYAYLGDVYKVLDKTGNWFKIQYNASTTAYIWSRYLNATETGAGYTSAGKVGATTTDGTTTTTPVPAATAKTITITNCSYCVNVRSGAGTTFTKLGYAYKDEVFPYTGTSGDWYIITYNGATAYVSSQFVKVNG